jgi:hypothetical protein
VFDVEQTARNTVDEMAWEEIGVSSWIEQNGIESIGFGISGILTKTWRVEKNNCW